MSLGRKVSGTRRYKMLNATPRSVKGQGKTSAAEPGIVATTPFKHLGRSTIEAKRRHPSAYSSST